MTIHAGVLREHVAAGAEADYGNCEPRRFADGALDGAPQEAEIFFYENIEEICKIFKKHDVSFSFGDGLRPGCIADASDESAFSEFEGAGRAYEEGVGARRSSDDRRPGHVPLDKIKEQVDKEMEWCHEAPFYTLGPLVIDIAPGYDHITSAHWRGDDRLARRVDAVLRDAEGAPRVAECGRCEARA